MKNSLDNAYALLIGVGNDLPLTVRDATALYNILADEELAGYKPENIFIVTEKEATRKGILEAFDKLIESTDEDSSVLLFYSGHGGTYSDNSFLDEDEQKPEEENTKYFHLVPNNFDPVEYETTWVKAEELKEKISKLNSRRLIFFLDCCHAEGMTRDATNMSTTDAVEPDLGDQEGLAQKIDDGKGMSIISSCRADQQSYIMEGDNNSLYTKCLIEVLKGKHKKYFEEPYVRISEVIQYIFRKVPERQPLQRPYANLQIYDDFILSQIPKELRGQVLEPEAESTEVEAGKAEVVEPVTEFRATDTATSVLLFVHGFSGEASKSFGEIPAMLMEDKEMDGWDMFPLGYTENVNPELGKNVWGSIEDIDRIADYLATSIKHKYGHYKRIAIAGHSLGGLVVQKALLELDESSLARVRQVILFGTPSAGLASEVFEKMNIPALDELKKDGSFIKTLRKNWEEQFNEGIPFNFSAVAGTKDEFVPVSSSHDPFPEENRLTISGNHFGMIKPDSEEHDGYQLIVDTLNNNKFYNKFTSQEEINIALGNYEEVVTKLLPKKDELDKKGLEQLIFALEGLDRQSEAMELLKSHPLVSDSSNFMGILGGRYKRNYLHEYNAQDGEEAFKFYSMGLKMSEEKDDYRQIYYHAINLAFLNAVYKEDHTEMEEMAVKAQEAAERDKFDNLWKLATLGEAQLYQGNFDKAKEYYEKAASKAGIREKISIHTNAFTAYCNLMDTQSEDDDFVKFLKTNFLS